MDDRMNPKKRITLLTLIMVTTVICVELITISILYITAIREERERLEVAAKSQARLIEAVARFDRTHSKDYLLGAMQATIDQIKDAHSKYRGFGETGEFTLSRKENNQIVFLLRHRHYDLDNPKPIPWDSQLAEPMKLALSGKSGTIIGNDYRGEKVLAAYEPVAELDLGIVAKIDISEIRKPFITASMISFLISILLIGFGVCLFFKITNPIVKNLSDMVEKLQKALSEVKTLRGILPICSYCKKNRDDKGYWNQLEEYIHDHSEAEFSHGICQKCSKKYYPDLDVYDD